MDIQRYKVGYYTDEWGMHSNTPCLIKDSQGYAVKFEDYEQLTARVRELEEENARLKAECDDIKQVQFPRKLEAVAAGWKKKLAASQAYAEQLREAGQMAVEMIETNAHERRHVRWKLKGALAIPLDTSALDAIKESEEN